MLSLKIVVEKKGKKPAIADFDLPQSWDEVPADILPHLASLYLATDKEMDKYNKTVRTFSILCCQQWPVIEQLQQEELYDLLKLIDWVFDKLDLTENKLPAIKIGKKDFYGPGKGMDNLRFGEWCIADPIIYEYGQTGDVKLLQQLAAILYRPAGAGSDFTPGNNAYRGDRREKFNIQLLEDRTKLMTGLTKPQLQLIYVFFVSCRQQIISLYDHLFPKAKSNDKESEDEHGWLGLYDDLRGDPKFGGTEKLEEEPIHSVFFSMERSLIKNEKLRKEYNL